MHLRQVKSCTESENKLSLETEKEKDAPEKAVEELKRQLQPKRTCTDDDTVDVHDLLAEFDICDLSVTCLVLVGWISYWCFGNSVLAVDILVEIKTFGVTEFVSDGLDSRK